MNAASPATAKRSLRIERSTYPITGVCEHCGQRFLARNEDLGIAALHLRGQFEAHTCEVKSPKNGTSTKPMKRTAVAIRGQKIP